MSPPEISLVQLAYGLGFILAAQGLSVVFGLRLVKDLAVGAVRTVAQLFLMGAVLGFVFGAKSLGLTLLVFCVMLAGACQVVHSRVGRRAARYLPPTAMAMGISFFLVAVLVSGVIVGAEPWWKPQVFIPMGGMVFGNTMTALALALERLFSELDGQRSRVEMRIAHGAAPSEAGAFAVRAAIGAGLTPAVASLMGVGLVSLPGMMTGQILAGADPMGAIRYQIVVMFMVVGSTALACAGAVLLVRSRCFDDAGRLRQGLARHS